MSQVSHGLDRVEVVFDESNLVANAGLILVATLVARLDLEALINATVRLVGRVGGSSPGAKVLSLVNTMIAGGNHIDHADVLRSGGTARVVGHRVYAPSTLGTFLRAFCFGHVRQLEAVVGKLLERAWAGGAGPGAGRLVIDVDSTICQVYGRLKAGAAYGYTKVLGYHPILATRADTGEILHARMRKGSANTQRGTKRFVEEFVARVGRAGATGEIVARFDSGYWSNDTIAVLGQLNVRYTMAVRATTKAVAAAIAAIGDAKWATIAYPPSGEAQVAECLYGDRRLIVRRTRLTGAAQAALWPDWRHFAFLTDLAGNAIDLDRFHRQHAVVELTIDDLKEGSGIDQRPLRRLLRQRGLAVRRSPGPQPDPLDRHSRRTPPCRPAGRGPHHPHPAYRHARPARQLSRHTHPARPAELALGAVVQTSPGPAESAAHPQRVAPNPAAGAPPTATPSADNRPIPCRPG